MVFEIRKYILEKLCFPQVLSIDKPGMILHKKIALFGGRDVVTRSILTFEENYIDLFNDTVKEIGYERSRDLWYKVGKDFMFRYLGFYKGFGRSRLNIKKMIDYFSKHFSSTGMSVFNNYKCDFENEKFLFYGSNCVICRYTNDASFLAGAISGMMTCFLNKNIEANFFIDNDSKSCKIIANSSFPEWYVVSDDFVSEISARPVIKNNHSIFSRLSTFRDFLKFGIIKMDDDKKLSFKNKTLIPIEIGLPMVFFLNYKKVGFEELYIKSMISSFEKIFPEILSNQDKIENKILAFRNIASAFGWAEAFFSKQGRLVKVTFLNPFFNKRTPSLVQHVFNAFLNYLYGEKFIIDSVGETGIQYSLKES